MMKRACITECVCCVCIARHVARESQPSRCCTALHTRASRQCRAAATCDRTTAVPTSLGGKRMSRNVAVSENRCDRGPIEISRTRTMGLPANSIIPECKSAHTDSGVCRPWYARVFQPNIPP
ncbi:uncharacterized protein B0H18DRAFT_392236 [Fomitopsis serialis]|uniref:uncharacterized protein n=1 Tax=Fomitopsis serialis TaxID=139415 RepID=UPI002008E1CD|nr:uncharacterized protein B0H18DRAFT_392236 [Neoantrodia serialis]KAH9911014.1 hypothetical protein B0H18DRAFT_392236 [Neoantrodia serialis]